MMKKNITFIVVAQVISLVFSLAVNAQSQTTYKEAMDPHPDEKANWDSIGKGLQSSFANVFVKFAKGAIPAVQPAQSWFGRGWKGERIYSQLILWSADSVDDIEFKCSDFTSLTKKQLPGSIVKTQFVRYVLTDEFGGGCDARKAGDFAVSLSADVLDNVKQFSMAAKTSRPVWISIDIPSAAEAGTYTGTLKLSVKNKSEKIFSIRIEVINQTLPGPADWHFYLDLWQNPYAVARYHHVKLWSEEHWQLLRPVMKMLADAGQKTITTSINNRPWGTQTEDPYESMIVWTKNKMAPGNLITAFLIIGCSL